MLHDAAGRAHRSRVEGMADGVVTVARPLDLEADHDLGVGTAWQVSWNIQGGVAVLPTTVIATYLENGLGLWSLMINGVGWVEQRRRFVRVPAYSKVLLRPRSTESDLDPVQGTLVDLSEGALRCAVDKAHLDEPVLDEEILACFRFGEAEFSVPARVESRRDGVQPVPSSNLIVTFDEPNKDADALRKQIYAQQRRTVRRT